MNVFIEKNFQIRKCYKYKGEKLEICKCGNTKKDHEEFPMNNENWSLENNTKLKQCDCYGEIKFIDYNDLLTNHMPKFIRFNCENESQILEKVYKLMTVHWNFFKPQLIISVNGGFKRMNFNTNQQKKNFKQSLIEVMKKDKTWIIGGGFNVGIHNLISEAVTEYRIQHVNCVNQVKLLGICTWGVIMNNQSLCPQKPIYKFTNEKEKGKVLLDSRYDGFLFCDDGTEKQYDKETSFRLKYENFVKENDNGYVVQILYEGGKRALESAYNSLKESIPLVLIKNSGRAADIIDEILDVKMTNLSQKIDSILQCNKISLNLESEELDKYSRILRDIYEKHRNQIFVHDVFDKSMKLDKKIVEAIISSNEDRGNLEETLKLTIKFNCYNIAEQKVFLSPFYRILSSKVLQENFKLVLKDNQIEFVKLFLENNFDIERFLTEEDLNELYNYSLHIKPSRSADLIVDLMTSEDKSFDSKHCNSKYLLQHVRRIINKLSGNILQNKNTFKNKNIQRPESQTIKTDEEQCIFQCQNAREILLSKKLATNDLFLWSLLTGLTDLSIIFWKIGKEHIGSALIGSIILNKMECLIQQRGYSDTSAMLSKASKTFQKMAISVVTEAYNKSQENTYTLLVRTLKIWNNMTCLQIAISGNLLEFLNQSACSSYTKKVWMGKLSPFLPTWKILVTIPFSFILIKPLIMPSVNQAKHERTNETSDCQTPECIYNAGFPYKRNTSVSKEKDYISFIKMIKIFYQAPIVKFVVHLISYIWFLLIFIYLNLVELKEKNLSIQKRWAEIFVCIYVFGIIIEEIRQIVDQERTGSIYKLKAYLSGSWNIYDICVILVFIISIFLRIFLHKDLFIVTRCFYSITLSMFCLRTMQFYFVSPALGPKVIMIGRMIVDILFFLSIFFLFIISYGTLATALQDDYSREIDLSLIKEIFYRPYFQTYGELMLDEFPTYANNLTETNLTIRRSTIILSFAVFLLLTNILLINLLIAMFGHTFNKIQVESHKFFSFIQLQLIEEFLEKPLLPPPLNIFYYLITFVFFLANGCCRTEKQHQNSLLVQKLSENENRKLSSFEQLCMDCSNIELESLKITKEMMKQPLQESEV